MRCGMGAVRVRRFGSLLGDPNGRLGREMLQANGCTDGWYQRRRVLCKDPCCACMRL